MSEKTRMGKAMAIASKAVQLGVWTNDTGLKFCGLVHNNTMDDETLNWWFNQVSTGNNNLLHSFK